MAMQVRSVKRADTSALMFIPGFNVISFHRAPGRNVMGRHFRNTTIYRRRFIKGASAPELLVLLFVFLLVSVITFRVMHAPRNAEQAASPPHQQISPQYLNKQ